MTFVKCKNDAEKLKVIKEYCEEKVKNNNMNINYYKADRTSILDYADEIHALELENMRFNNILKIIEADEFTSVLVN